jgi:hypothetical protein
MPAASAFAAPGPGVFSLLAQALPAQPAARPMAAFAMARSRLQPAALAPSPAAQAVPVQAAAPAPAASEAFGVAFAAAYNGAFGNGHALAGRSAAASSKF